MRVSYRTIARLLASKLPVYGQEYSDMIEEYTKSIEAMPPEHQQALRASYIFSCMAPLEKREDIFQNIVSEILTTLAKREARGLEPVKNLEPFCYRVAQNWWRERWAIKKKREKKLNGPFISLNSKLKKCESGQVERLDTITDKLDHAGKLNSELDVQRVLDTLPDGIKATVIKRLEDYHKNKRDYTISSADALRLWRYATKNEAKIRQLITV